MSFIRIFFLSVFVLTCFYASAQDFKEERSHHFIIKYAPGVDEGYVYDVKREAEYLYRSITQEFHLSRSKLWVWDNRAIIYIAEDNEHYLKEFNCQSWSAACVDYRNKIIYTFVSQKDFYSTLSHELTHIIFREYIGTVKVPLWLDEGMATYIQYKDGPEKKFMISSIKKSIRDQSYIDFSKINEIYSFTSDTKDVELFYQQAFSMVYFLIERFGRSKFSEFLMYLKNGRSFDEAFYRAFRSMDNMEDFERLWIRFYAT